MSRAREMQQEHEAGLESLAVLKFYFTRNSVTYSQFTELFEALEGARRRLEKPDTEDEQRVNERPIEAEAHALEVLKLVPEPRGDLCEVPEQAGSVEVEETELGVEAKGQSKVEAPHSGGWSAILKSTAISTTRKSTKEAALRVRTPQILYTKMQKPPCVKGEARQLQEGPHLCYMECCVEFSRLRGWGSSRSKAQAPTGTRDKTRALPFCTKGSEESNEHETPLRLVCLLWRVFSVFLEDTLEHNPALSHWTLILVRGLMLSCFCEPTASIYENLGHQERAKRWQSEAPP
ncbi:hypothetical protein EV401DRAFT_1892358 [Pisolithus croceorrhizus]|nr:hypothetical protein EV401DRAFT_1892358 [Pisolithus croceorrhizus]